MQSTARGEEKQYKKIYFFIVLSVFGTETRKSIESSFPYKKHYNKIKKCVSFSLLFTYRKGKKTLKKI